MFQTLAYIGGVAARELLMWENSLVTVEDIRQALQATAEYSQGVPPEEFWAIARHFPYSVEVCWNASETAYYDVLFQRKTQDGQQDGQIATQPLLRELFSENVRMSNSWNTYANSPIRRDANRTFATLEERLRLFLEERLPEYMLPSGLVFLETMPLNVNGKVDRKQLRVLQVVRTELTSADACVFPRDTIELELLNIF